MRVENGLNAYIIIILYITILVGRKLTFFIPVKKSTFAIVNCVFFIDFIRTFVMLKGKQQGKTNDTKKLKKNRQTLAQSKIFTYLCIVES